MLPQLLQQVHLDRQQHTPAACSIHRAVEGERANALAHTKQKIPLGGVCQLQPGKVALLGLCSPRGARRQGQQVRGVQAVQVVQEGHHPHLLVLTHAALHLSDQLRGVQQGRVST